MAVNLKKGQKISLKKSNGHNLSSFCVGANWGAIEKNGFFGKRMESVDLDLSIGMFDGAKNLYRTVYFGNTSEAGIRHSGDDLTGDTSGDDGFDNEVIVVNLNEIPQHIEQIVFVLNSYQGHDFATIPFASIRLYEGTPRVVRDVVAKFNISHDKRFSGYVSMILGKLYRRNGEWKFSAIGEPTQDRRLNDTLTTVRQKFL
jgi:tellurium resistance protein TerZ